MLLIINIIALLSAVIYTALLSAVDWKGQQGAKGKFRLSYFSFPWRAFNFQAYFTVNMLTKTNIYSTKYACDFPLISLEQCYFPYNSIICFLVFHFHAQIPAIGWGGGGGGRIADAENSQKLPFFFVYSTLNPNHINCVCSVFLGFRWTAILCSSHISASVIWGSFKWYKQQRIERPCTNW